MKKRLMIIAVALFLGLGFSCEDTLDELVDEPINQVENSTIDNDDEQETGTSPGQENN